MTQAIDLFQVHGLTEVVKYLEYCDMQISVIIPTYNRAATITRAIDSVLAQSYPVHEIIIVDDGSEDDTQSVVGRYSNRVRYIYQSNKGSACARNTGIRAATHELIAFLDSDDYWLPRKLEVQVPLMVDQRVVLSFTNWWLGRDASGQDYFSQIGLHFHNEPGVIDDPLMAMSRSQGTGLQTSQIIARRTAIQRVGMFDERLKVLVDVRMWVRLAFEGKFAVTSRPLGVWVIAEPQQQITQPLNNAYQREAAKCGFAIFMEAYARAGECSSDVQRALRKRITSHLASQSKYYALDGDYRMARRRALECLAFLPKGRIAMKTLVGLLLPRAFSLLSPRISGRHKCSARAKELSH
jgi:glycosyltransferase involved in cell wall biosynthesis